MSKGEAGDQSPTGEWISVPEAARLKGVTETSIRVAIQTGRLAGGKVGRSYIVRRRDVEAWRPGPRGPKHGHVQKALAVGEPPENLAAARTDLREALRAYLTTGSADPALERQILQLPGGAEALERLARIDKGQRRFAGLGFSTGEYLRWKQEEIEQEQCRDAARDA